MPEPNRICQQCKTPFYAPQWRIKKEQATFCSAACLGKSKQHPVTDIIKERMRLARLASKAVEHKIAFQCDNCGEEFWEYPKRRPKPLKFCNRACCIEFQRGRVPSTERDANA